MRQATTKRARAGARTQSPHLDLRGTSPRLRGRGPPQIGHGSGAHLLTRIVYPRSMAATAVRSTIVIVIATMIWLAPLHRAWAVPPPTLDGPPITTAPVEGPRPAPDPAPDSGDGPNPPPPKIDPEPSSGIEFAVPPPATAGPVEQPDPLSGRSASLTEQRDPGIASRRQRRYRETGGWRRRAPITDCCGSTAPSITRVRPARGLVVPTLAPTRTGVTLGVAGQL